MPQFALWPTAASPYAVSVDHLVFAFTALVVVLAGPVFLLTFAFAVKYRRTKDVNRQHAPDRNVWLEVSWAAIPFVLVLAFYTRATFLFVELDRPTPGALTINVTAKQWMWKMQHPGGQREIDELHVPVGETIRLVMTSEDVIHSFYLPALRIKRDVVPGRYSTLSFTADRAGSYRLSCAEFCGADHSLMGGRIEVMEPGAYGRWLEASNVDHSLAQEGAALFRRFGCSGCHGESSTVKAPALGGLYGRPVALDGGGTIVADEQYIRDSILLPGKQVTAGYPNIMPTFANVVGEDDLVRLVAYIKSLKPGEGRRG